MPIMPSTGTGLSLVKVFPRAFGRLRHRHAGVLFLLFTAAIRVLGEPQSEVRMTVNLESAATTRWLNKPVHAFRLLDDMENPATWKLNTDPHFSEGWLLYLIAEMQLGTPKEKFLSFGHRFHDYNCLEAVAYLEAGYKVTNLDQFELKPVKNSLTVVYKGTEKRVNPFDIRLTSDLARQ